MGCMNVACGVSSSIEWKKGWALRSGGYANLCDKCWYLFASLMPNVTNFAETSTFFFLVQFYL